MSTDPADLANLKDLAPLPDVAWWPPAPGWWIVVAAFLVAGIFLVAGWHRRYRADAYRRAAADALAELAHSSGRSDADRSLVAAQISELLKRTALAVFPRAEVAGLSGKDWLAFLDRTGRHTRFTQEPANALPQLCLGGDAGPDTIAAAIANARRWIRTHRAPDPGAP